MNKVTRQQSASPTTQRGAVVLLLLLIIAVSTAAYFLVKNLNNNALNIERDKITAAALVQARDALIGRAASDSNRPGELPCPDVNNDGQSALSTICANHLVGRLPWRTLRLPDLRDGYGERLWYALSDNFHATGSTTTPLNTTTTGLLSITGTSPANAIIAIVFSAGPVLGNQIRDGSGINSNVNNVQNYLEGENANGDPIYEARNASDTFNDKLLPITYNDLFSIVTHRVAGEIGQQLVSYYSSHNSTFPSTLSLLPLLWLANQNWTAVTTYIPPTQPPPTQTTLVFNNCTGLTYTIDIGNNSSKTTVNGHSC
jgi:hypothetical protein